jgi:serine protease Do
VVTWGLSFAIPVDVAMDVVAQLKNDGRVTRGWMGVTLQEVTQDLARSFNLEQPRGALVAEVTENSPAAKAGLKAGDIIVAYAGKPINDSADLPPLVGTTKPGANKDADRDPRRQERKSPSRSGNCRMRTRPNWRIEQHAE